MISSMITGTDPKPGIVGSLDKAVAAYLQADLVFGKLPKPDIDTLTLAPETKALFSISDNKTLPDFPPTGNVYLIEKNKEKLGDADSARATAVKLGFEQEESRIVDELLLWESPGITRTLTFNKTIKEWSYSINFEKDQAGINKIPLMQEEGYYSSLQNSLLSNISIKIPEFQNGSSRIDYIALDENGKYIETPDANTGSYARIALYKLMEVSSLKENYRPNSSDEIIFQEVLADVRKLDYLNAPAVFVVQGEAEKPIEEYISFDLKEFNYGAKGVYPLMSAEEAWDNVQQNKGYLNWLRPQDVDLFSDYKPLNIREFKADSERTSLIYIDPDERNSVEDWTHYLQPFYLFEGVAIVDDGRKAEFAFLIEAIPSNQYK